MKERLQQKQETQLNQAFEQIHQTIIKFNTQQNQRIANNSNYQRRKNQVTELRPQRSEKQTNGTQNATIAETPLQFYKQLTSMSINEEISMELKISNGSVPTAIKPMDCTDPGYTVYLDIQISGYTEYLNSIIAAMILSNGIEPVNQPGHYQLKIKRAALIIHLKNDQLKKSTLLYQVKLNWIGNNSVKKSQICLIPKNQNNKEILYYNKFKNSPMNLPEITRITN